MRKTLVITGASKGIGKAIAREFANLGMNLAIGARNKELLVDAGNEISKEYGVEVLCLRLDVGIKEECERFVREVLEHFGKVDVLVNNAGVGLYGLIKDIDAEEFDVAMKTNVYGPFWMIQAVMPSMITQKSGTVINISSVVGKVSLPFMGVYAATKFAVNALSKALRGELKSFGIHTILVMPGVIATDFEKNAIGRYQQITTESIKANPEKLAKKVLKAYKRGKDTVIYPLWYAPIISIINTLPKTSEKLTYKFLKRHLPR